jgi:glucosylceramidase
LPQPTTTPTPTATTDSPDTSTVQVWATRADGSHKLTALAPLAFAPGRGSGVPIDVDHSLLYQTFEGAGAALTDSSAWLIDQLDPPARHELLQGLFGVDSTGIGLSLLRVPLGASDFALSDYTYDDMPTGQTDEQLASFSIAHDEAYILPTLRHALAVNPRLRVMATPWSPPAWMKTSQSLNGGTLDPRYRQALADYLVKSVQAYDRAGVPIAVLTPQNEPQHESASYPSMRLSPQEQVILVRDHLGPAMDRAALPTKLLVHDHNWDLVDDPLTVLRDPQVRMFADGVAFHCYGGEPAAQSSIRARYPSEGVWFTECSGGGWATDFGANVAWTVTNLIIDNFRNWGRSLLLWNLVLDETGGPTNGGCQDCRGVVTVDPTTGSVRRNEEYYALGHLTRFVQPGARRISSTDHASGGPRNVAFRNPDGSLTVLVHASTPSSVSVNWDGRHADLSIPAGGTVTLHWAAGLPPVPTEPAPGTSTVQGFEAEGSYYAAYQTSTALSRTLVQGGESSLRSHADAGAWHTAGFHPVNAPADMRAGARLCLWVHEQASNSGNTLGLRLLDASGASQELWSDHPAVGTNPTTQRDAWVRMCFATSAFTQVDLAAIDRIQLTTYWPGTYHFDEVTLEP